MKLSTFNRFFLLSIAALCFTACSNNSETDCKSVTVLRRNIDRVSSMDPIKAESAGANRAVALVYETLVEYDYFARPYALKPYLLKTMPEIDETGKIYRFTLRDDIFFGPSKYLGKSGEEDVRAVTAEDVVYSLKRLADAKLASPGYWTIAGKILGIDEFHKSSAQVDAPTDYNREIAGLRIINEKQFEIELVKPSTEFLWILAMPYTAVVPRDVAEQLGSEFGTIECGSGPYTLASWQRNYSMIFKRRPNRSEKRDAFTPEERAEGLKSFEEIHFFVMDDASTRWLSFLAGGLDINQEISRDNWDAVIAPDGGLSEEMQSHGVGLVSKDSMMVSYIAFNMDDGVVGKNKLLRQAMTCAFDAEAWIKLNKGRVAFADGPVPPNVEARLEEPNPLQYNLERAKELITQAGYKDGIDPATGRPLQLTLDLGRTDQETRESAELIASFMQQIGIELNLQYNNWPLFLKKISRRESQLFMVAWLADYPDALNFLQLFYSENASPGPNRCNYNNPEYDKLYEAAYVERNPELRGKYIREMQRIIRDEAPWIFIHYGRDNILLKPNLENVIPHDFPYGLEKHWRTK